MAAEIIDCKLCGETHFADCECSTEFETPTWDIWEEEFTLEDMAEASRRHYRVSA